MHGVYCMFDFLLMSYESEKKEHDLNTMDLQNPASRVPVPGALQQVEDYVKWNRAHETLRFFGF